MRCPMCRGEMVAHIPPALPTDRWCERCRSCGVIVLQDIPHSPERHGQAEGTADVSLGAMCDLLQTAADVQSPAHRIILPVAIYLVAAVETISIARDRESMRRRLAEHRRILADQLSDLIPNDLMKRGAQ